MYKNVTIYLIRDYYVEAYIKDIYRGKTCETLFSNDCCNISGRICDTDRSWWRST